MATKIPIGLIAVVVARAFAADCLGDPGEPVPSAEWRSALAADFPYQATPPAAGAAKAAGSPSAPRPADPSVIALPAFVVQEASPRGPSSSAMMPTAAAPPRTVAQKLGIGDHEIKLKHVTLHCTTFLFLPILVGIDW
jgi:hypothetical protein